MGKFQNQIVFITGASSGIGKSLAESFFDQGAHLVLFARRIELLEQIKAELHSKTQKILIFAGSVTDPDSLRTAVSECHQQLGKINVAIANAGFGVVGDFLKLTPQDYERQFQTNIFGLMNTVWAAASDLIETKGRLGLVGSVNGFIALPGNSPYAMSKFAVRALSDSLYHELGGKGVSVTHIAPGFVRSEIRKVNNHGKLKAQIKDPVPEWLQMPTATAAMKIMNALYKRKRERIVTAHGYWAVLLQRFFPSVLALLLKVLKISARGEA